jgi:3-phenylpropionate/cinnamic acid dioxygenase small subunit
VLVALSFSWFYFLKMFWCQANAIAGRIASGALTSKFVTERQRLERRIECLRTQHTEAARDKSAAENKSCNLLEKLWAVEKEREDLSRRLAREKEGIENARAEA